ncbi:MAG: ATP-binding protein [Lachnospiraceae bacterium]
MSKKKDIKITTLSKRLLLSSLCALVISVMAVNFVVYMIALLFGEEITKNIIYLSQLAILIIIIILFYKIVDYLILQRLQQLSDGMAQVADGHYETEVPVKGNDELSELTVGFNRMVRELQTNAFLSKDFARYVSHEFKTPLAVIRNYAEITQDSVPQTETAQNMDVIMSEADRLTRLSKDILELCKLDSTTIIEKRDHFSPATQIRSIILDLQLLWSKKNIEIIPRLDEFETTGNEALLFRVWQNIIGNAVKFTGEDGQISIVLKKGYDSFSCTIADNGIGISDKDKEYIFTPFYSGNCYHNKDGSGLGLSLSRKIVEKLGGTISFESSEGVGSVFTISIPY